MSRSKEPRAVWGALLLLSLTEASGAIEIKTPEAWRAPLPAALAPPAEIIPVSSRQDLRIPSVVEPEMEPLPTMATPAPQEPMSPIVAPGEKADNKTVVAGLGAAAKTFAAAPRSVGGNLYDGGSNSADGGSAATAESLSRAYSSRLKTRAQAMDHVLSLYQRVPHNRSFVVYIDGPIAAGKTTFGAKLASMFSQRLGRSARVWHKDEDNYAVPDRKGFHFETIGLQTQLYSENPHVLIYSLSGDSNHIGILDRPPDAYLYLRPSEPLRQWQLLARIRSDRANGVQIKHFPFRYALTLLMSPLLYVVNAANCFRQFIAPSFGKPPDIVIEDSLSRRIRERLSR